MGSVPSTLLDTLARVSPTEPLGLFVAFAVVLIAMHMCVIFRIGHRWFWAFVEYAWLGLASLAIISAAGQYRMIVASEKLPTASGELEVSWDKAILAADRCERYYREFRSEAVELPSAISKKEFATAISRSRGWCEQLKKALAQGQQSITWRKFLDQLDENPLPDMEGLDLDDKLSTEEFRTRVERRRDPRGWSQRRHYYDLARYDAAWAIDKYARNAAWAREVGVASQRTELERAGLAVGPWMIAIGLALRISKVSADLRGLC